MLAPEGVPRLASSLPIPFIQAQIFLGLVTALIYQDNAEIVIVGGLDIVDELHLSRV